MPWLAVLGVGAGVTEAAIAAAPAIALVVTSALTAAGEIVKCKVGPKKKCKRAINGHDEVSPARITPDTRRILRMARRQAGACGVPQYNFDMCHEDLKSVVVQTSIPADGGA
jgi:hypothetical protein